jgi:hypothetical protein
MRVLRMGLHTLRGFFDAVGQKIFSNRAGAGTPTPPSEGFQWGRYGAPAQQAEVFQEGQDPRLMGRGLGLSTGGLGRTGPRGNTQYKPLWS